MQVLENDEEFRKLEQFMFEKIKNLMYIIAT